VDWSLICGEQPPTPALLDKPEPSALSRLLRALEELPGLDDADSMLRRAVEIARSEVGLERAGIFLLDPRQSRMLGTWGTGADGALVDEHHVMYDLGRSDREVYARAESGVSRYTVFENCPLAVQLEAETEVMGRGWVACTPIRGARGPVGMLFNDGGRHSAPLDEAKQAQAVVLCAVLGTLLDVTREVPQSAPSGDAPPGESSLPSPKHPKVVSVVKLLATQPSLEATELGKALGMSPSRLARVFKGEMGMSLVEYRNRIRLERFFALVDRGGDNLLSAALDSGFGSYAQFHRVFRAVVGQSPRDYLRGRETGHLDALAWREGCGPLFR
jgi:AraC-like DNA-binding protein